MNIKKINFKNIFFTKKIQESNKRKISTYNFRHPNDNGGEYDIYIGFVLGYFTCHLINKKQ